MRSQRRMPQRCYYVYVIGLDPVVLSVRRFRAANPGYLDGRPCVYVGSSARPPARRFEQHLSGYRANRFARDFGTDLLPHLYERYNPVPDRASAEEIESYVACRLRSQGYGVWSN